jgi:hypothetical protein
MTRSINKLGLFFVQHHLRLRMLVLALLLILFVAGMVIPGMAAFADSGTGGPH